MSDSDSSEDEKTRKRLTATQQLRNLVNGLLNEADCPEKDRMKPKERARWEEMGKALDESRISEAEAKAFLERLRGSLANPEPRVTKKDIARFREWLQKTIEEDQAREAEREARLDWEAGAKPGWEKRATKKKPPGSGYVM